MSRFRHFLESIVVPSFRQKRACQYGGCSDVIVAFVRTQKLVPGLPSRSFRGAWMTFFDGQLRNRQSSGGDVVLLP